MVVAVMKHRASYRDLLQYPEGVTVELIDGELYTAARPAVPHAGAASQLGMLIGPPFRFGRGGPGGWIILDEPELHFGPAGDPHTVVVPDLAGWRRERMPAAPAAPAIELAPDWLCEVLSPSTALHDRKRKMKVYAEQRVSFLWFLDPIARSLETYRLAGDAWQVVAVFGGDEKIRALPFEAIELDLADVWAL